MAKKKRAMALGQAGPIGDVLRGPGVGGGTRRVADRRVRLGHGGVQQHATVGAVAVAGARGGGGVGGPDRPVRVATLDGVQGGDGEQPTPHVLGEGRESLPVPCTTSSAVPLNLPAAIRFWLGSARKRFRH